MPDTVDTEGNSKATPFGRFFTVVNTPLFVSLVGGLLLLFLSNHVQNEYWKEQQQSLRDHARVEQTWAASRAAEEEIVRALGKRLAATASVISAHSERYALKQHLETVVRYDNALEEWEVASEVIKFQIAEYFDDQEIHTRWEALNASLEDLHRELAELEKYEPAKPSNEQDAQASKCNQQIDVVSNQIVALNKAMYHYAANGGPQ